MKAPVQPGRPDAGLRRRCCWAPRRRERHWAAGSSGLKGGRSQVRVRAVVVWGQGSGIRDKPSQRRRSRCPGIGPRLLGAGTAMARPVCAGVPGPDSR